MFAQNADSNQKLIFTRILLNRVVATVFGSFTCIMKHTCTVMETYCDAFSSRFKHIRLSITVF